MSRMTAKAAPAVKRAVIILSLFFFVSTLVMLIPSPFYFGSGIDLMNDEDEQERQQEQDQSHRPQSCVVFTAFHGAAHVGRNSCRQRTGRQEQGRREDFHLADDHGDSQGFAQSTGQA